MPTAARAVGSTSTRKEEGLGRAPSTRRTPPRRSTTMGVTASIGRESRRTRRRCRDVGGGMRGTEGVAAASSSPAPPTAISITPHRRTAGHSPLDSSLRSLSPSSSGGGHIAHASGPRSQRYVRAICNAVVGPHPSSLVQATKLHHTHVVATVCVWRRAWAARGRAQGSSDSPPCRPCWVHISPALKGGRGGIGTVGRKREDRAAAGDGNGLASGRTIGPRSTRSGTPPTPQATIASGSATRSASSQAWQAAPSPPSASSPPMCSPRRALIQQDAAGYVERIWARAMRTGEGARRVRARCTAPGGSAAADAEASENQGRGPPSP